MSLLDFARDYSLAVGMLIAAVVAWARAWRMWREGYAALG